MGLIGGPHYFQDDYFQWEVFFRGSDSTVVGGREIPWGASNSPLCISHSLVITPLQACPAGLACLASNCWRNQNTKYGSCRHPVEKHPCMHLHKTRVERERRESTLKEKQHLQQAGVSLTEGDIKDSSSDLLFDRLASLWFTELIN